MSAKNESRRHVGFVLLAIGAILLSLGVFADSGWSFFLNLMGVATFMIGGVMLASLTIIKGAPWITRLMLRYVEPVWEGEILHTDGGYHQVRYLFDEQELPCFVASDVCIAIGTRVPPKGILKCGGVPLQSCREHACFSETSVQDYLLPLATNNYEANRLLLLIRNNVLRKLNKQRDAVGMK